MVIFSGVNGLGKIIQSHFAPLERVIAYRSKMGPVTKVQRSLALAPYDHGHDDVHGRGDGGDGDGAVNWSPYWI